jgi:hypothetical protein
MSCSAVINPVLTLVFLFLDAIFISCYMKLNNMAWAAKDEIFDLVKDGPGERDKDGSFRGDSG